MSECGGRGGGGSSSSSSDDAEDEGGGGGGGPAGSGSFSPAPAAASSAGRLRRGLRGASLMARRRPELLCGAVALGCALLVALKFTCRGPEPLENACILGSNDYLSTRAVCGALVQVSAEDENRTPPSTGP
uniref:Thioredoxin domain containing 11 n=1 Tax=Canis lupus familiaris TaxID=9615 RepID=A0A8C0Q4F9_CANLF